MKISKHGLLNIEKKSKFKDFNKKSLEKHFINVTNRQNIYGPCNKMKKPMKVTIFFEYSTFVLLLFSDFFSFHCLSSHLLYFFFQTVTCFKIVYQI